MDGFNRAEKIFVALQRVRELASCSRLDLLPGHLLGKAKKVFFVRSVVQSILQTCLAYQWDGFKFYSCRYCRVSQNCNYPQELKSTQFIDFSSFGREKIFRLRSDEDGQVSLRVAQRALIPFIAGEGFEDVGAAGSAHERGKEAVGRRGGNEETFRQLLRKRPSRSEIVHYTMRDKHIV